MPRLPIIVLLDSELPSRIIMRMRHHKHLQFLLIPLVPFISHTPSLLPRAAILIQELDLIIEVFGSNIHSACQNGVVRRLVEERLSRPDRASSGCGRAKNNRLGDSGEAKDDEKEEEEGETEADSEEV